MSGNPRVTFFFAVCFFIGFQVACNTHSATNKPVAETKPVLQPVKANNDTPKVVVPGGNLVDKSPMDVLYFPPEYPKYKMIGTFKAAPVFRVLYSRPQLNGRQVFGSLIKYGEPWRLGANEATEIEFFKSVHIKNQKIPVGKYILYCIPEAEEWTIVLNSDIYSWGLKFNSAKDLFKFKVPVMHVPVSTEIFTIDAQRSDQGAELWIAWDKLKVFLPITF